MNPLTNDKYYLKSLGIFFLICLLSVGPVFAQFRWTPVRWIPTAKVDLLGGQLFFEGKNTSFTGHGNWLFAPGMKYSDKVYVLPLYSGKYRRMREVQELIGGGFLTKQTFENAVAVNLRYVLNQSWTGKLKSSFRNQMLVESKDEDLGKGLFDNNKLGFGIEMERAGRGRLKSLKVSFDPYLLRFIHYKSLSSGSRFGKEIKSGVNVLDYNGYDTLIGADVVLLPKLALSGSNLFSFRSYTDQNTVSKTGVYEDNLRKDLYNLTALGASYRLPNFAFKNFKVQSIANLDFSYAMNDSNQDNYDASRNKFNSNYYDYSEYTITPKISARMLTKLDVNFSYSYSRRNYSDRMIQSKTGTYKTDLLYQNNHTLNYSLKYPLVYGLSATAQGIYRKTTSNMEYEKTYLYTYDSQHYYLGISWQY